MRNFLLVWIFFVAFGFVGCEKKPTERTQKTAPSLSPSLATRVATKTGWWVRICNQTMANGVVIRWVGSKEKPQTWRKGEEGDAPQDVRDRKNIAVQAKADPTGGVVHMCIYYKEKSTEQMLFNDIKSEEVQQADQNDCACA